jgi:hypothetical protein
MKGDTEPGTDTTLPVSAPDGLDMPHNSAPPQTRRQARHHARRNRRRPRWWVGPLSTLVVIALLVGVTAVTTLGLTGRTIPAPRWVVDQVEARANAALGGQARVAVGGIDALVDRDFIPRIRLKDVTLYAPSGARLATLPDVRADFDPGALTGGHVLPRTLRISGAQVALRRLADGRLDVPQPQGDIGPAASLRPFEMLDAIDAAFAAPGLSGIDRIEVSDLSVRFDDARTGRTLSMSNGLLSFTQTARDIHIELGLALVEPGRPPGQARLTFSSVKASPEAHLDAMVTDVPAQTLAAQSPALAWLQPLDAPISGSFRSGIDATGRVERVAATLDIGAGALRPNPAAAPVGFARAHLAMDYDPDAAALTLDGVEVDSASLRARGSAKAWLKGLDRGFPTELVGQVAMTRLMADPQGLFDKPVEMSQGALDFKLDFNPFVLRVGQLSLSDRDSRILASGTASAEADGWHVALDASVDRIDRDRLVALWPTTYLPKTRAWLDHNVHKATVTDLRAALRAAPGQPARFSLGYDFADAEVTVIRALPPVTGGAGHAAIFDHVYTLSLDQGQVAAGQGGPVDVAGSVLKIPDIRVFPARADVTLNTESSVTAALWVLDQKPFGYIAKAGLPVDLATGRARATIQLGFDLDGDIRPGDVIFSGTGTLSGVATDRLVAGRPLSAQSLLVSTDNTGVEIGGEGLLSGVRFRGKWRQDFAPSAAGRSRVTGSIELSQNALDAFGVGLPRGTVRDEGNADVVLDLARGQDTRFTLTSDLDRVTIALPGLGWTKPPSRTGRLEVRGTLGKPQVIDRLALDAPGLSLEGSVSFRPDGRLDRVRLPKVRAGGWFEGGAEIVGQGDGQPVRIVITGGTADMRRSTVGGAGAGLPLSVSLDRLTIAEGLALTGLRGEFSTAGGFNGSFTGAINGAAAITGAAAPTPNGTGFRIRADDAGAVFRAAGIFTRARGGSLDATFRPIDGGPGRYDGELTARDVRVVDAPVLAELIGAISVVGLLEQLNGSGIVFSDVKGKFRIRPGAVEITEGSAVGVSLGVSGAGVYDAVNNLIDLRGTISPIYLLNGIGQIVSKSREGLFGFNYRLSGPTGAPKISVNPLSILTPGLFREIFRAQPPTLDPKPPVVRTSPPIEHER